MKRKILFLGLSLGLIAFALLHKVSADDVSRAHVFVDGEVLTAALLNGEFDPIVTQINDLTGANLKSDIAITTSGNATFNGTFTANGDVTLGNGANDNMVITMPDGISFESSPQTTLTFVTPTKVSGTWSDLGTVTTVTFAGLKASADLDIGSYEMRAQTFESDVSPGTAPFTIASTTVSTNLNADLLDGSHASTTTGSAIIPIADSSGYLPDNSVDTTALKTTTGEVSGVTAEATLPGGTYGFYPQIHADASNAVDVQESYGAPGATYITRISFRQISGSVTVYAQQRYVTASGEDLWVFLLLDKATKEIIAAYQAPDAPHYGNGGDYNKVPHPFGSYNLDTQEIILLDKETANLIKSQATQDRSILTIINEDMKVDYTTEKVYEPLHSGKFLTKDGKVVKEMVWEIAPYIKVKSLQKYTTEEKMQREEKRKQEELENKQKIQNDKNKLETIRIKLNLTKDELELLKNNVK